MYSLITAAFLAADLLLTSARPGARALPSFHLISHTAGVVTSEAVLPSTGKWLLVYVVPGSAPSDRLIQALGESWSADTAARVVIIVAGDSAKAQAYLADKGGQALARATWYADPASEAWTALGFQGTLAVAGVAGTDVDWKLDGVIQDPDVVAPAVRAWLDASRGL
jgi:hypothetical protein